MRTGLSSQRTCSTDAQNVEIQFMIYDELMKETSKGDWSVAIPLTMKLFELLQRQREYGWLVDVEHMQKCINLLDHWVCRIDKVLTPKLPSIVEVLETKKRRRIWIR